MTLVAFQSVFQFIMTLLFMHCEFLIMFLFLCYPCPCIPFISSMHSLRFLFEHIALLSFYFSYAIHLLFFFCYSVFVVMCSFSFLRLFFVYSSVVMR